jgi:hypothetical protein
MNKRGGPGVVPLGRKNFLDFAFWLKRLKFEWFWIR